VANLPENYLGKVKRGQLVDIHFPALELDKKAKVSLVGRTIDPANRTFKIEVDISNKDQMLKPNLLAIVKINDLSIADALVVPQELVLQEISGKEFVMVAEMHELIVVGARNVKAGDPLEVSMPDEKEAESMKKK